MANTRISFTGNTLKWIAIITMVIDHIGAAILEQVLTVHTDTMAGDTYTALLYLDEVMRAIGRLAMPLFVFLLVEGFSYTRSRLKYLLRLLIFCFISEVPFDLAFYLRDAQIAGGSWYNHNGQNVFFTLTIGFAAMLLIDCILRMRFTPQRQISLEKEAPGDGQAVTIERFLEDTGIVRAVKVIICIAVAVFFILLAQILNADYLGFGVLAILLAYVARMRLPAVAVMGILVVPLVFMDSLEAVGFVDILFIWLYNGRKGRSGWKWFFYIFYPAHLMVLFLIRYLTGIAM